MMFEFDNRFVDSLPADKEDRNFVRQVQNACYSFVKPTTVAKPQTIAKSRQLLNAMGWSLSFAETQEFADMVSGNHLLAGMQPYAMCYGGHQFGNWAGQLGDGRAINLGEVKTDIGLQALQLKGAGMTPYSRHADGLAVLRSSIREYLCSEAMHHLGVPTTRALSLVLTGEQVERDMFYDGHPELEPGAIVCRVAPSFLRFGSFEIFASRNDVTTLKTLADFCIREYFPELNQQSPTIYLDWFNVICQRTLEMIIHWQRVGFVHGVMNTDNMSILGLTIDYGPYGWIDNFDQSWTPNTTDLPGRRYAFGGQAHITHWNLYKLAEAIYPLIGETQGLEAALRAYPNDYKQRELAMQCAKLGLPTTRPEDSDMIETLKALLQENEMDMTLFYRQLAKVDMSADLADSASQLWQCSYLENMTKETGQRLHQWLQQYRDRLQADSIESDARRTLMDQTNPWFVLRNYLAQQVIEQAHNGDYAMLHEIETALLSPYQEDERFARYVAKRPAWANNKAGCSMLSCSS